MAKNRYTGKGGLVKIESGNTFVAVGLCRSITPPPQQRAVIDVTGMEDTVSQAKQGIEQLSAMQFICLHDPADTTDDLIDSYYGNGGEITWQVLVSDGTTSWTKQFEGFVLEIIPQAISGSDAVLRQVTVQRTGAITDNTT